MPSAGKSAGKSADKSVGEPTVGTEAGGMKLRPGGGQHAPEQLSSFSPSGGQVSAGLSPIHHKKKT